MNCPHCNSSRIRQIGTFPPEYQCDACDKKMLVKANITEEEILDILNSGKKDEKK